MRERGHDSPDVRSLSQREDAAGQGQQVVGARPVGASEDLGSQAEVGGEAAGQVRADRLAGRCRLEDWPVLDVVRGRTRLVASPDVHPVLGLWQEPEVVVALDGVAGVAVADPDLDVQDLLRRIPQLL